MKTLKWKVTMKYQGNKFTIFIVIEPIESEITKMLAFVLQKFISAMTEPKSVKNKIN